MITEKQIYNYIRNFEAEQRTIEIIEEKLESYSIRTTSSLSVGSTGGSNYSITNKTEDYCIAKEMLRQRLTDLKEKKKKFIKALDKAQLTTKEMRMIQCIMDFGCLSPLKDRFTPYELRKFKNIAIHKITAAYNELEG